MNWDSVRAQMQGCILYRLFSLGSDLWQGTSRNPCKMRISIGK